MKWTETDIAMESARREAELAIIRQMEDQLEYRRWLKSKREQDPYMGRDSYESLFEDAV